MVEKKEAKARREVRTRLARPNFQARTRIGKLYVLISLFQLTTSRISTFHAVDPYSATVYKSYQVQYTSLYQVSFIYLFLMFLGGGWNIQ